MQIIADRQALDAFLSHAMTQKYLACDTEFVRTKTYYPDLALIQIASTTQDVLIDPLAFDHLEPLRDLFETPDIVKVFHAPRQDIEILRQDLNFEPKSIFDTQIAASLDEKQDQIGYEALAKEYLDVQLDKTSQFTNWLKRPLTDEQLDYAAADVTYLIKIYEQILEKLDERAQWAFDVSSQYEDCALYETNLSPLFYKWMNKVKGEEARLKLWGAIKWREERAQKVNRPKLWIIKDKDMLDFANGELSKHTDVLVKYIENNKKSLLKDIADLHKNKAKPFTSSQRNQLKALKQKSNEIAQSHNIPLRFLADKHEFDFCIRNKTKPDHRFQWQHDLLWQHIDLNNLS